MKQLDACLSPDLLPLHILEGRIAVIVDILRATSCMTAGIGSGVAEIRPFASLEECLTMREKGFLIAGERNGQKVDGFDLGNSPFDYMASGVSGQKVAVTTTNGTVAIDKSRTASDIIIGSFLNISSVAEYLLTQDKSVLIVCAGWKGKVNLEDTLFAGALTEMLLPDFELECDAPRVALATYQAMQHDLLHHVLSSSHAQRLNRLNIGEDIEYCLKKDEFNVLPALENQKISSRAF
jgi:2-phosphosulfolactate phosphatase